MYRVRSPTSVTEQSYRFPTLLESGPNAHPTHPWRPSQRTVAHPVAYQSTHTDTDIRRTRLLTSINTHRQTGGPFFRPLNNQQQGPRKKAGNFFARTSHSLPGRDKIRRSSYSQFKNRHQDKGIGGESFTQRALSHLSAP